MALHDLNPLKKKKKRNGMKRIHHSFSDKIYPA
jgi:hypothetical protein